MTLAEKMLSDGIISRKEYDKIDRIIAKSRGLDLSGICCRKALIYQGFRANMTPTEEGGEHDGEVDNQGQV